MTSKNKMRNKIGGMKMKILEETMKEPLCIEDLAKLFRCSWDVVYRAASEMKKEGLLSEEFYKYDLRRKDLSPTKKGIMILRAMEKKESMVKKLDDWLNSKFKEVGIDPEDLFKL